MVLATVSPILPAVELVNTYPQVEQLQRILHVLIVHHAPVLRMMMVQAVPVRRIPVVVNILHVPVQNTRHKREHRQRMLNVLNDVLTEQVMLTRLPVLRLLVHVHLGMD